MNQKKSWKWALVVSMALASPFTVHAAGYFYDFENLTAGSALTGQDGWTKFQTTELTDTVESVTPSHTNTTKVAQGEGRYFRVNDANYSFPAHSASETAADIQYDVKPGVFANGDDTAVGLGRITMLADFSRVGPTFGFFQSGATGKFSIRQANFGAFSIGNLSPTDAATDWYRLLLHIDFTANAFNGSGSLLVRNLTDGETTWRTVISGANLGIQSMAADSRDPATWNSLYIHGASQAASVESQIDNLLPIPEPASVALVGLGGLLCLRRRLAR